MEAHHTGIQWTNLEVKRSKVKVTRPINAHTVNVQYLQNGKDYELHTWYTDAARRPASATSAMTFKVRGQGRKVTWLVWQVFADKSRKKRPRNTKIGMKVVHLTYNNAHQYQGQRSRSPDRHNVETGSKSYLSNGKAYKLQTWYTHAARRPALATSAVTFKVKGQGRKVTWCVRLTGDGR